MSLKLSCRRVAAVCALALVVFASGCQQLTNPAAQAELQKSMYDLQDMLMDMRDETALLQGQVDSLRFVVARQDSTMRQLSNLLGAPMR